MLVEYRDENVQLKAKSATLMTLNDQKDAKIETLESEVAKHKKVAKHLDDGALLDICAKEVWLVRCMNDMDVPERDREAIKSLYDLDEYIRSHPNGKEMYRKLDVGVKDAGGPACLELEVNVSKQNRNNAAHHLMPVDPNAAMERIKKSFPKIPGIEPSTVQFLSCLDPKLVAIGVQKKRKRDVKRHGDAIFLKRNRQTKSDWAKRNKDFLEKEVSPQGSSSNDDDDASTNGASSRPSNTDSSSPQVFPPNPHFGSPGFNSRAGQSATRHGNGRGGSGTNAWSQGTSLADRLRGSAFSTPPTSSQPSPQGTAYYSARNGTESVNQDVEEERTQGSATSSTVRRVRSSQGSAFDVPRVRDERIDRDGVSRELEFLTPVGGN